MEIGAVLTQQEQENYEIFNFLESITSEFTKKKLYIRIRKLFRFFKYKK